MNAMAQRYCYHVAAGFYRGPDLMFFEGQALDPDAVIWHLRVTMSGSATLKYDETIVGELTPQTGLQMLRSEGGPLEIAEALLEKMTSKLAIEMHEHARMVLESDLSHWIAENF